MEIFEIDFRDSSLDLKHKGILSASSRYYVGTMHGFAGQTMVDIEGPGGGVYNSGITMRYRWKIVLLSLRGANSVQKDLETNPSHVTRQQQQQY